VDRQLKQRVVGAGLLVAFGVIFIPIFLDNGGVESPVPPSMNIPPPPTEDVSQRAPPLGEEAIAEMEAQADEDVELPPPRVQTGEGQNAELLPGVTPSVGGEPPLAAETLEEGVNAASQTPEITTPIETPAPRMQPPSPRSVSAADARPTALNADHPPPMDPKPAAGKAGLAPQAAQVIKPQGVSKPSAKPLAQSKPPAPPLATTKPTPPKAERAVQAPVARPLAPLPPTVAGWTVQLGSFANDVNARKLVDKLKAAGYRAYSEPRLEQHVTVFKVRVGPTPGKAEAERLRQRIEAQFDARGMLVPAH
jgi:DedD protein